MVRGFKISVEGEFLELGAGSWEPGERQGYASEKNETVVCGGWSYRLRAEKARRKEVA
jgi:hypothetical protein